jgi:pyridoxine kinase
MGPSVAILSIQSRVVYSHVGNAMAEFALHRLGYEVWPIDTVSFSNRPDYGTWRGRITPAAELAVLVEALAAPACCRAAAPCCPATSVGGKNGGTVLAAVEQVRAARPVSLYCCDPVMGDRDSGLYVADSLIRFFRDRALFSADIVAPNHYELEVLAGRPLPGLDDVLPAVQELRARGPPIAIAPPAPIVLA